MGRRTVRVLWGAAALAVLLLVLKVFVADAYRIASGSMRPTLFGGAERPGDAPFSEWVLVLYGAGSPPARFDLVVTAEEGHEPIVKRVAGLPGETVQIVDGDLLVDGERLPLDAPRPAPIPVFDDALLAVEDYFDWKGSARGGGESPWTREDDDWLLDALDVPLGSAAGTMLYRPELRDDYFDERGRRVVGLRTVHDALVECEVKLEQGDGVLRFALVEKGDTFELLLSRERLVLWRRGPGLARGPRVLLERPLPPGALATWAPVRFGNVDDQLLVQLPSAGVEAVVRYDGNRRHPLAPPAGDETIGARVGVGGESVRARFRRLRVLRDLHYTAEDRALHGVQEPVRLGPADLYLLGDHSRISNDSRHLGPVPLRDVLGRPLAVVWPPGRARLLAEPEPWARVAPTEPDPGLAGEEPAEPEEGSSVPERR